MKKSFTKQSILAAAAALLAGSVGTTDAAVLYSSLPDYTQTSYTSNSTGGGASQECTPFTLGTGATITQISFWGDYSDGTVFTDGFTFGLYLGSTAPAATALATTGTSALTKVDTGLTGARHSETYFYTATLTTPFQVTGGTGYSVSVLNSLILWDWQLGAAGTEFYRNGTEGTAWRAFGTHQNSIQLIGTVVPEPSTWALMTTGAGLLVFGIARKRHTQST